MDKYYKLQFRNKYERVFSEVLKTTIKFIDRLNANISKIKTFQASLSGSIQINLLINLVILVNHQILNYLIMIIIIEKHGIKH